jgi:hypothetical protein
MKKIFHTTNSSKFYKFLIKTAFDNESGQALVFVIATMTIALAVGVGVSLRNLASISRTTRTDTSTRAQAAAEGGAENILSRSESALQAMAVPNATEGHVDETIEFTPTTNDNVTAVALVNVDYFNIPSGQSFLPLEIRKGQLSEVKLSGTVQVCWKSAESGKGADLFFTSYSATGATQKIGYFDTDRSGFPTDYGSTFDSSGAGRDGFNNCVTPTLVSNAIGLRVRAINATVNVGVYPSSGTLPNQGYKITSTGKLRNAPVGTDAEAVVTVIRSFPFMPGMFDFSVYSGSTSSSL